MNKFTTNDKATVQFIFDKPINDRTFEIYDSRNDLYFFRELTGQKEINVNIAKADSFTTNTNAQIKIKPLEIKQINYELPPIQKDFSRDNWTYTYNPDLQGTPARNFYRKGIIETGPKFWSLPFPVRVYILCHERGHAYYHDETLADIYGVKMFLNMGYNKSTAFYAIRNVLNLHNEANQERLKKLFEILK